MCMSCKSGAWVDDASPRRWLLILVFLVVLGPATIWQQQPLVRAGTRYQDPWEPPCPRVNHPFLLKDGGGETLCAANAPGEDIKRLYALRTFDDIQVLAEDVTDGIRLIITVVEKPAVHAVTFTGNRFTLTQPEISKRLLLKRHHLCAQSLDDTVACLKNIPRRRLLLCPYKVRGHRCHRATRSISCCVSPKGGKSTLVVFVLPAIKRLRIASCGRSTTPKEYTLPVLSGPSALYKPGTLRIDLQLLKEMCIE